MGEVVNKVRQEAAAEIINQCKQWLAQVIEEEKDAEQEAARYIAEAKQKVEQIAAEFKGEVERSLVKRRHKIKLERR